MNGAKAFVPFRTMTGITGRQLASSSGGTRIFTSFEKRFAQRYRAANSTKQLFFIKDAASGGCQSRNLLVPGAGYCAAAEALYSYLRIRPGYDARTKIIQIRPVMLATPMCQLSARR